MSTGGLSRTPSAGARTRPRSPRARRPRSCPGPGPAALLPSASHRSLGSFFFFLFSLFFFFFYQFSSDFFSQPGGPPRTSPGSASTPAPPPAAGPKLPGPAAAPNSASFPLRSARKREPLPSGRRWGLSQRPADPLETPFHRRGSAQRSGRWKSHRIGSRFLPGISGIWGLLERLLEKRLFPDKRARFCPLFISGESQAFTTLKKLQKDNSPSTDIIFVKCPFVEAFNTFL